ncbi:MAG TPA: hypothetical protein ENJ08_05180 [Gammaproteobacteria bacterium]|nr:hypothetical protein [Gammaproteobacteria bacterium]
MCGIKNPFLPGMSADEITEITTLIGEKTSKNLPDELIRFWEICGGSNDFLIAGPWYIMSFQQLKSSLEMIYDYKENHEKHDLKAFEESLKDETYDGDLDDMLYTPESDKLKKIGLTYDRIPFAHNWSGDYLLLDLDPVDDKNYGQIMNYFNSETRMALLNSNLAEYFALYNSEIANGNIFWREGYESIEVKEGSKAEKIIWDS